MKCRKQSENETTCSSQENLKQKSFQKIVYRNICFTAERHATRIRIWEAMSHSLSRRDFHVRVRQQWTNDYDVFGSRVMMVNSVFSLCPVTAIPEMALQACKVKAREKSQRGTVCLLSKMLRKCLLEGAVRWEPKKMQHNLAFRTACHWKLHVICLVRWLRSSSIPFFVLMAVKVALSVCDISTTWRRM